jgi:hypothetical protein
MPNVQKMRIFFAIPLYLVATGLQTIQFLVLYACISNAIHFCGVDLIETVAGCSFRVNQNRPDNLFSFTNDRQISCIPMTQLGKELITLVVKITGLSTK